MDKVTIVNGIKQGEYEEYHKNGEIIEKGFYVDNIKNGPFERFDKYGRLIEMGSYKNGIMNGKHEIYGYFLGKEKYLSSVKYYKNGKLDGIIENYHRSGELVDRTTYKKGIKHGAYESYSQGELFLKGDFVNGLKEGVFVSYGQTHFNGENIVKEMVKYTYKNGERIGPSEHYYESGEFREIKLTTIHGQEIFKDGLKKVYHKTGKIKELKEYKNGKLITFEVFHDNGVLKEKRLIVNGKDVTFESFHEKYYDNGKIEEMYQPNIGFDLKEHKTFNDNNYSNKIKGGGTLSRYYRNGNLKDKGICCIIRGEDYLLFGKYEEYYESGQLKGQGEYGLCFNERCFRDSYSTTFESGRTGDWVEYFANGKLKMFCTYSIKGIQNYADYHSYPMRNGIYVEYYENGQLKEKGFYNSGNKDLFSEEYYENGQLKEKCEYQNCKKERWFSSYYDNGQVRLKTYFKNGKKNIDLNFNKSSIHQEYYKNGQLKECGYYKDDRKGTVNYFVFLLLVS